MRDDWRERLQQLPTRPGVYLFRNAQKKVIYVGKAKSLRNRVRAYLTGADTRAFVRRLEGELDDIEVVLTQSDKEALLLENELIKRHRPKYNVKLVDDSNYLCLRLDTRKSYPRVEVRRRFGKDGARYFGPYHSASSLRQTLRVLNRYFQLRTCSDEVMKNRHRPCLQYQIKRCPAPCVFDLKDGSYDANVQAATDFLEGRTEALRDNLDQRMRDRAENLDFEQAARLRDQLKAVEKSLERQRVISVDAADRDIVGMHREGPDTMFVVMRIRSGRPLDTIRVAAKPTELPDSDIVDAFLRTYYEDNPDLPREVLIPSTLDWAETFSETMSENAGHKVRVMAPQRGEKRRLLLLAQDNARQAARERKRSEGDAKTVLEKLKRALRLRVVPERLECFDISHHQGSEIVASGVHFADGKPDKAHYRRYRINTTDGQDDFRSMYEVISRRVRKGLETGDLPDLFVIDGGKGQLNAAIAALRDHGADDFDVIALAKARTDGRKSKNEGAQTPERVFVSGQKEPIILPVNSAELFLLTRARDEAHRFAIAYQRRSMRKRMTHSEIEEIAGVGPSRKKALLVAFGSIEAIRAAEEGALAKVVGPKLARVIIEHLNPKGKVP